MSSWQTHKADEERGRRHAQDSEQQRSASLRKQEVGSFLKTEHEKINHKLKQETTTQLSKTKNELLKQQHEAKTQLARQRKVAKSLETAKQQQLQTEEDSKTVKEALEEPKLSKLFEEYSDSLHALFSHYSRAFKSKQPHSTESLTHQGFNRFLSHFNIWPGLLSLAESTQIFTLSSKHSPSCELSYNEFAAVLLKISLKARLQLEKASLMPIRSSGLLIRALFQWMHITPRRSQTLNLLQEFTSTVAKQDLLAKKKLQQEYPRNFKIEALKRRDEY